MSKKRKLTWRDAIGCSPAPEGSELSEVRIRRIRDTKTPYEIMYSGLAKNLIRKHLPALISVGDAAKLKGVSTTAIRKAVKAGKLRIGYTGIGKMIWTGSLAAYKPRKYPRGKK